MRAGQDITSLTTYFSGLGGIFALLIIVFAAVSYTHLTLPTNREV